MRDVHASGSAVIAPRDHEALEALRPQRWAAKPARLSRMDRSCALALLAADAALLDGKVDPAAWNAERVAVVVGSAFGCHATNEEYYRGLLDEGVRGASPRLFAYTLPSSPVGEITIHYGARGPAETVVSGRHAGLEAVEAAARLCERGVVDLAIAVAVDVQGATLARLGRRVTTGAAALLLERGTHLRTRAGSSRAQLLGGGAAFASAHPEEAGAEAILRCLADAQAPPPELEALPLPDGDDAVTPLAAVVGWLAAGSHPLALALATDAAGGATALCFAR